jgi:hypothetical protein
MTKMYFAWKVERLTTSVSRASSRASMSRYPSAISSATASRTTAAATSLVMSRILHVQHIRRHRIQHEQENRN